MRSVLQIEPTTNYALASPTERHDQMESLARVFMGLSHPIQILGQAAAVHDYPEWPRPPQLARRWLAVVMAEDETSLAWRTRTLQGAFQNVGLRCEEFEGVHVIKRPRVYPNAVQFAEDEWAASLVLRRWPREVAPGWLGQALAGETPVDVGIHIQPQDPQRIARFLRRQQSWQSEANHARPDAGTELGRNDAERVRLKLIARTDRPCKAVVVLTVRARDRAELRQRVETTRHEVGLALGDVREATFEQDRGYYATQPYGTCELLGAWHTLDCASIASTWLFQPATVNHEHGAEIGTTHDGGMLVKLDPFDLSLESFGGVVVSKVGMGKSYLLKLLTRRLKGVEVLIVEQRIPAEYGSVPGATTINLADVEYSERAAYLRDFVSALWETAKRDPRPRLLVLDELWSLLRDPALATLIEEIARIGRHHYLSLWIATQQVRELLESGRAVLDNAAIRIYLKQHDRDLGDLCDAVGLPAPARRFLRSAPRGQALLDVGGMLVPVDIQASPRDHLEITTDPRERRQQHGMGNLANGRGHAAGVPARAPVAAAVVEPELRPAVPAAAE